MKKHSRSKPSQNCVFQWQLCFLLSNTVMAVVQDSNLIPFFIYSANNFSNRIFLYRYFISFIIPYLIRIVNTKLNHQCFCKKMSKLVKVVRFLTFPAVIYQRKLFPVNTNVVNTENICLHILYLFLKYGHRIYRNIKHYGFFCGAFLFLSHSRIDKAYR